MLKVKFYLESDTSGTFQNRLPNICNFVTFEIENGCAKDH